MGAGLNGRHGCVRDLMPSAQYYHFSFDHLCLSPYCYLLLALSPLFHFSSSFLPSLSLKESLFRFLFSTHLCLCTEAVPTFFPFLKFSILSCKTLHGLAFLLVLISYCLNPSLEDSRSFLCLQIWGGDGFTSLHLSRLLFLSILLCGRSGGGGGGGRV